MNPRTAVLDVTLHSPSENINSAELIGAIEWASMPVVE